jgi:hypothetical protein
MANTILEKLQEKYPNAEGIDDARNIAEAVACINETGGRGANAIADVAVKYIMITIKPNGGDGTQKFRVVKDLAIVWPSCTITPPEGKIIDYYCANNIGADSEAQKMYPGATKGIAGIDMVMYAIWKDAE